MSDDYLTAPSDLLKIEDTQRLSNVQQVLATNINIIHSLILHLTSIVPIVKKVDSIQDGYSVYQFDLTTNYDADNAPVDPAKRGNNDLLSHDALNNIESLDKGINLIWETIGVLPYEVEIVFGSENSTLFYRRKTIIN